MRFELTSLCSAVGTAFKVGGIYSPGSLNTMVFISSRGVYLPESFFFPIFQLILLPLRSAGSAAWGDGGWHSLYALSLLFVNPASGATLYCFRFPLLFLFVELPFFSSVDWTARRFSCFSLLV